MEISRTWASILICIFLYSLTTSIYIIFTYTDPFPNIPQLPHVIRSELAIKAINIFMVFLYLYFIKTIWNATRDKISFDSYSNFTIYLLLYLISLSIIIVKELLVNLLWADLYSGEVSSLNGPFYADLFSAIAIFMYLKNSKKNKTVTTRLSTRTINGKTETLIYHEKNKP